MHDVNTKKNLQFEYIRAFSIIAVIAIHTFYSALLKYGSMASIPDQVLYHSDMLFVTAWNEWAECGYLEPDEKYKYGYLEAIKKALENNGEFEYDGSKPSKDK